MMSCPKRGRSPTPECQAPSSPSAHFILVRGAQLIPGFRIIFSIPAARGDGAISTCKEGGGDRHPPTPPILPPLMPTALSLCRNNPRCQCSRSPQFCWGWQVGGFWPGPSKPPGVGARQAPCGAAPRAPLPRLVPQPWPDSPKLQPGCCPSAGLARKLLPWLYVQGCTSACPPPPAPASTALLHPYLGWEAAFWPQLLCLHPRSRKPPHKPPAFIPCLASREAAAGPVVRACREQAGTQQPCAALMSMQCL